MGPRNRGWIILALILGTMLASLGGVIGFTYLRALKAIDEFSAETSRRAEEWERTGAGRPPVFGGPHDGNAWTVYEPVLSQWRQLPGTKMLLVPDKRWHELKEADFLPTLRPSIDTLRRALGTEAGTPGLYAGLGGSAKDACVTLFYVVQLLEDERPELCLELVTVLVGLKQDLRRTWGDIYSLDSGSSLVIGSWKTILEHHRLPPETLRELARRLEALERTMPTAAVLLATESPGYRSTLHRQVVSGDGMGRPNWKVFWSSTIDAATVLRRYEEQWRRLDSLLPLPRAERLARVSEEKVAPKVVWRALELCEHEDQWAKEYVIVRLAVALARFELDRGAMPSRLEDLVPEYLDALPRNLPEGFEVRYEAGQLYFSSKGQQDIWTVRRARR
jgi:hypothetical protein